MRRLHKSIAIVSILLPGLVGGWVLHDMVPTSGARVFADVLRYVETSAIEGLTQDEIYERAARGLVDRLGDDYADLYSPQELATFSREQLGSAYGGLGMQIEDQAGTVTVTRVFPSTPAERGGVRAGDRILTVNGESMRGLKLEEVSGKLVGQPGTNVEVAFGRAGIRSRSVARTRAPWCTFRRCRTRSCSTAASATCRCRSSMRTPRRMCATR